MYYFHKNNNQKTTIITKLAEHLDHFNIDIQPSLPNSSFRGIYDSETCTGFAPDLHFI